MRRPKGKTKRQRKTSRRVAETVRLLTEEPKSRVVKKLYADSTMTITTQDGRQETIKITSANFLNFEVGDEVTIVEPPK